MVSCASLDFIGTRNASSGEKASGVVKTSIPWLCLMLIMLSPATWADESLNDDDGNSLTKQFEVILEKRPHDAKAQYNLGTVFYHKGYFKKAADLLAQAMGAGSDSLRGHAAYNLGSTHYRQARTQEALNRNQMMHEYENALEYYRIAIRQDPADRDAQFNYELTQRRMEKLAEKNQQAKQEGQKQGSKHEKSQELDSEIQKQNASQDRDPKKEPLSESSAASDEAGDQQEPAQGRSARAGSTDQALNEEIQQDSISPQQALWILDNFKREEQKRALEQRQADPGQIYVEKNW